SIDVTVCWSSNLLRDGGREASELQFDAHLQNARGHDFLHAAEVRRRQPRGVECGLTGEALRRGAETVLSRARVEQVVHFGDERDAVLSADPESLVAPQRQQVQEVLTVRASGLDSVSGRTLRQRYGQVAIAWQTAQRLII